MTTIGSLFTGYGGLDMAVEAVTGGYTIWRSDIDPGACKIIAHHWPDVPNLGDISTVDWSQVEPVDIITGGFPCQDVSTAGRRAGLSEGTRSGLWAMMADAIDHLRPSLVVIENVRGLLSAAADSDVEPCPWCVGDVSGEPPLRALGAVLGDLADIGYDAAWHGLTAASVGAPHGRFRVFIVAWPSADADRLGHERAGGAWGRWDGPADDSDHAAHADRTGLAVGEGTPSDPRPERASAERGHRPAADATGDGRHEGWSEPAGIVGRHDAAECGGSVAPDADRSLGGRDESGCVTPRQAEGTVRETRGGTRRDSSAHPDIAWGQFESAIARWESLTRPAPSPTETSTRGGQRLSPRFVEWMMGLPEGHVTEVPGLTRNEQLKALGNGVVPQQAEAALRALLSATAVAA